jgi:hypothetical protein
VDQRHLSEFPRTTNFVLKQENVSIITGMFEFVLQHYKFRAARRLGRGAVGYTTLVYTQAKLLDISAPVIAQFQKQSLAETACEKT